MKKNQSGFTLIELLAVITIMGILMMVAIPSVSRTIENSRRDTFANTATAYIDAVKNAVASDELLCSTSTVTTESTQISSVVSGTYYLNLATETTYSSNWAYANATALMETGGKSSWGSADVRGNVEITKTIDGTKTSYSYRIILTDKGNHGTKGTTSGYVGTKNVVKRSDINAVAYTKYDKSALVKAPSASILTCKVDA